MDARDSDDLDSKPAAKKVRRNELEVHPHASTETDHPERRQSSGGREEEHPPPPAAAARTVADSSGNLDAMLWRELASRLMQQQQQYVSTSFRQLQPPHPFAYSTVPHRLSGAGGGLPIAGGLPMTGGIPMQPMMPPPQSGLNFGMPPQMASLASHSLAFLPQPPASGLGYVPSFPPAAMNPFGQNVEAYRGGAPNLWAGQLSHQQPTMVAPTSAVARIPAHQDDPEAIDPQRRQPRAAAASVPHRDPEAAGSDSPSKVFPMSLDSDEESISKYQCLLRKQVEFFEASAVDLRAKAQGRNVRIRLKQIGIRCTHCVSIPAGHRSKGAVYFPVKLSSLYQSAQNMSNNHFNSNSCNSIPESTLNELNELKHKKAAGSGGGAQCYWVESAQSIGIVDAPESGLEYRDPALQCNPKDEPRNG